MKQIGFYFDQTRCTGCYTCSVACKDWYDTDAGPENWMRIIPIEKGKFPNLSLAYFHKKQYKLAIEYCDKAKALGLGFDNPDFLNSLKPYRDR